VLARVAFERQAAWIRALTWVRDTVMAMVGVKSSREIGAAAATRGLQVIGYFPVLSKSAGATGISTSESRSWCARTRKAGGS
jgi:hypothetical protein